MNWNNHMSTGGWVVSIFVLMFLIALAVGLVAWIGSRRSSGPGAGRASSDTIEILNRRLATGELSVAQYEQLRRTLNQGPPLASSRGTATPTGSAQ